MPVGGKWEENCFVRIVFLASRPARRTAVTMLQWTTVAGCLGIRDLAGVMETIGNRTMYPLFAIACCIVFYLAAAVILELLPYAEEKTA
ncbi:MAG: hypothetical protein J5643_02845 [Lachnospiraceae bacterium]|nr:hypothetical protein [Lachnospiraceae bacterium]